MWVTMSAMLTLVFAVGREIDFGENASARAERQTWHVRELRAGSGAEGPAAGSRIRPAQRLHGHSARGDHVLLDERRRHLQRRRDVVEALGDVVCRQDLARVELDGEQIADRVCVFLAVEPMQDDLVRHVRLCWPRDRANLRARRPASRWPRASGCRAPGGGMTRPRSLRTAFSNTSACWPMLSGVMPSKLTPAILARSL